MLNAYSPSMRKVALLLAAVFALASLLMATGTAQAKQPGSGTGSLPVTGTLEDGGTFEGTVSDLSTSVSDSGELLISGTLTGTATDATGVTTEIVEGFTTSLTATSGDSCQILFLDLGPIFLDLLGLQVDLSQITLDVTAVPGAGNLLGNLLCAVAGLLDNPGNAVNAISNLLNQVISLLG
ncbi:hypothetical protein BH23ACT11_BH23ACT11_11840 [soil metagenome]